MTVLPYAVAAWLFGAGLYGIATSRNFIHLVGCLGICQSATYVLLLGLGYRWGGIAPIFYNHPPGTPAVDPVMQALVLTDIVVGATLTALLLVLTIQVHKRGGSLDPETLRPMRGTGTSVTAQGSQDRTGAGSERSAS
ncbi:sodium:proton antiporter [Methylobacterium sp. NEAU K]|uniref:sodium:proton antiporter n=1 Tax=Methylobacterium sp. NEAU K TaxID=3064946 RepID=UPI002732F613|nr:cation:proton antiporter subunit C [Methylobacterium sp. NEAU K]MDP4003474.1 cation:proton antiporter subunit C [Methylobacterium sp. NEAU K]